MEAFLTENESKRHQRIEDPSTITYSIPEELMLSEILPRLPFKSLCRFRVVCKKWSNLMLISKFGLVTCRNDSLVFLPIRGNSICITKPSLNSGLSNDYRIRVIASTNGLLCLEVHNGVRDHRFLYVCDPTTRKAEVIPDGQFRYNIALAFDPLNSAAQYKLVQAVQRCYHGDLLCRPKVVDYGFEVFSSDTKRWVVSKAKLTFSDFIRCEKSLFVKGVIYWDFYNQLISLHLEKDVAKAIEFPALRFGMHGHEIGIWEGQLTYTRAFIDAVRVWSLNYCNNWEQRCEVRLQGMLENNRNFFKELDFFYFLRNLMGSQRISWATMLKFTSVCTLRPLPFDGEELYLRVRVEDSTSEEMVMSYNIKTCMVVRFCMLKIENPLVDWVLPYKI